MIDATCPESDGSGHDSEGDYLLLGTWNVEFHNLSGGIIPQENGKFFWPWRAICLPFEYWQICSVVLSPFVDPFNVEGKSVGPLFEWISRINRCVPVAKDGASISVAGVLTLRVA